MARNNCLGCHEDRCILRRGLCQPCYLNPTIRKRCGAKVTHQLSSDGTSEDATEEEIERTIAEQRRWLPGWWWDALEAERAAAEARDTGPVPVRLLGVRGRAARA